MSTRLLSLIEKHRRAVARAWLSCSLDAYHRDGRRFLATRMDRFDNPVGSALRRDVERFLEALARGAEPEFLAALLTQTLKIRAVQEMRPADAIRFIPALKQVVRRVVRAQGGGEATAARVGVVALEERIDEVTLYAFEIYARHREKLFEVRVDDVKRQVAHLLRRSAFFGGEEMPPGDGTDAARLGPGRLSASERGAP